MRKLILFLFLISIFITPASSKKVYDITKMRTKHIGIKDGLSNQRTFKIEKDADGFIWMANRSGIARYDGSSIKNYLLFDDDVIVDELGKLINLTIDQSNILWAFTDSGKIFRYNKYSDSFVLFCDARKLLQNNGLLLHGLYIDKKQTLWLGTSVGFVIYDNNKNTVNYILKDVVIKSFTFAQSQLCVSSTTGVYLFNINNFKLPPQIICRGRSIQTSFYDEHTGYLYMGSFNSGLYVWDTKKQKLVNSSVLEMLPKLTYRSMTVLDSTVLLLGVDGAGIYAINRNTFDVEFIINEENQLGAYLQGNGVYDIYNDGEFIWVATYTGGVNQISQNPNLFEFIEHNSNDRNSLANDHINSIVEDKDGDIWYGTNKGVSLYLKKTNSWKHFLPDASVILSLCADNNGDIWAGGYGLGVYCLNKNKGIIKHFRKEDNPATITTNLIYNIMLDNDNNLWFGGLLGKLTKFNPTLNTHTNYDIDFVNSITQLNTDTIAVATANGFFLLNKESGKLSHLFTSPKDIGVKSNSSIYSMLLFDDYLWFGTDGGGLNKYNLKTNEVVNYSTKQGLPSNYVYGIIPDNKKRLWISTSNGLVCFIPDKNIFISIERSDGLQSRTFNFNAFAKLENGNIVLGATDGAIIFNPEKIEQKDYNSKLIFTGFNLFYQEVNPANPGSQIDKPINELSKIDLRYNENSFSFNFTAINFRNPEKVIYSVMLEGFDKDWVDASQTRTAGYTNIPPGKYIFKVRTVNKNGLTVLDERQITITINQPWWNTLWAWVGYALLLSAVGYYIWRFYKERYDKKYSQEKIDFFINTAHDIRTPVTLIMAPLKEMEKIDDIPDKAKDYLKIARRNTSKLMSLVTQLLDFQADDVFDRELIASSYPFIEYMEERIDGFRGICESKHLKILTSYPDSDVTLWFEKDKMDKVIDNLLSNAVKYTPANGIISIKIVVKDNTLELYIIDTGIGIPDNDKKNIFSRFYRASNAINLQEVGSGIGLLLTSKLVKKHKGDISFTSKEGEGTTFKLTFRLGNSHFEEIVSTNEESTTPAISDAKDLIFIQDDLNPLEAKSSLYKVMVVEDNEELRYFLKSSLSDSFRIIDMADVESAITYLQDKSVDLVVSDIMLPGIHGDQFCKMLKSSMNTSHIPIILLTAKTDTDSIIGGLDVGADDYITKPFDIGILRKRIDNLINNRQLLRKSYINLSINSIKEESGKESIEESDKISLDTKFLEKSTSLIVKNMDNSDFTINDLCNELALSRTLVYEKLKALTGLSPNEFIRMIKMEQAIQLLSTKEYTIQKVAEMCGFPDPKYFSTVFKKYFNQSPSEYLAGLK